jgi:hypothetical protein
MYIVLGNRITEEAKEKYLILELETFNISDRKETAYCIVLPEDIINEMPDLERLKGLQQAVITAWNCQDYDTVLFGLPHLEGRFAGELDTFYANLKSRIPEKTA